MAIERALPLGVDFNNVMSKDIYDTDKDGIVDNSKKLDGHEISEFVFIDDSDMSEESTIIPVNADTLGGYTVDDIIDRVTPTKGVDYFTEVDKADMVAEVQATATQIEPLYAESTEWLAENGDTSKVYVLPDGFIYAYLTTTTESGGSVSYTNQVPISTDTDGSIYNGVGYKNDTRLSSSGDVSGTAQTGSVTTGFIPCTNVDVLRIKGAVWLREQIATGHFYVNFYKPDKSLKYTMAASSYAEGSWGNGVTYDATTGITTFDFKNTTLYTAGNANGATFVRINAYGKGADLIVTVNQEITESSSTTVTTNAWTSTGHAFVPADYEGRILTVESKTTDNTNNINQLKEQVNDIIDGTTDIATATKFDATVYGLPVLYLTGDTSPIAVSKDNKVTLDYTYEGRTGTCTLKGQGATSYKKAQELINAGKAGKFNYTINFNNAFEAFEGWGSQKKYCLKANWIDHSHSRNVVSAKIWGNIVKSRATANATLNALPNGGAVDGFPIVIVLNGEFHGLYTFNIPKDGWMFGLVEDATKTQAIVAAKDHTTATQFKEASTSGYEIEFASNEDDVAWVDTSLTQLINVCISSNGNDLDTTVAQYLDLESAIDYYILVVVIRGGDMVDKNFLLTTFDGTKWHFSAYDMDGTYGLEWDGSKLNRPVTNINFVSCADTHRVFELIKRFKTDALKARYKELRQDILSESRICQMFENFAWAIPSPVALEDVKKYPTILGSSVNSIDQIARWVRMRLEQCDKWINNL